MVYLNALVDSEERNDYGGAFFFLLDDFVVDASHDISDEKISEKLRSATKLKGILLDRDDVIDAFDSATTMRNSNKASGEQFTWLNRYIKQLIKELWVSLEAGDISMEPYLKGTKTPCSYCPYKSLCRFDTARSNYRKLRSYNKTEAWEHIKGGEINVD